MKLNVNDAEFEVSAAESWESLLFVLRERLGLYGSKNACEQGECGSCSVLLDDQLVCSCLVAAGQAVGRRVVTIEGLDEDVVASAVRQEMHAAGAVQCGFCTPGFVVAATALLRSVPKASADQVAEGLAGNLCRCTGYRKILQSVGRAQQRLLTDDEGQT